MVTQAVLFLLETVTGFLSAVLLLRFFMQVLRVSFSNQVGTFVVELTNWLVKPLRRVLPGMFGLDLASLLPAYLLQVIFVGAVFSLRPGMDDGSVEILPLLILWRAALTTLRLGIHLLIGALLVQAVLSWVRPYSPLSVPLSQLTRPFLRPIQRLLPPIGAIDLSPLVAIVLAQLLLIFL
ncbi:MAG TPA: YggT family protein [Accumulibacter sp.]|jgi:YggT family protein|nr:YggT family protein [Accumulibacter sp.]HQC79167.1 YggT family protein [Accumulibacter sp.]